ncbi:hypothetical protein M426DRAFT_322547 [Hypoxylon sp. CI-4A]|nr:hypothetical protein M426DRAFT_322547 [Hypoxylon sp. CI-4A]
MPLGGKGPTVIGVLSMETFLILFFVGLRFFTRKTMKGGVGSDDYVLMVTWAVHFVAVIAMVRSAQFGFGQYTEFLTEEDIRMATFWELVGQTVISVAMGTSKLAVGMFLMRIVIVPWQRWLLWFWNFIIMFFSTLETVCVFTQCFPVESLWDTRVAKETCPMNLTTVAFIFCSLSFILDFFLAAFPWYVLKDLNMPQREKTTICLSLSVGVFAGICGIVRTTTLTQLSHSAEYLQDTADSFMWTSSELTTTVVCVSVPILRPLWGRFLGTNVSNQYYKHSEGSNNLVTIGRMGRSKPRMDTELGLVTIGQVDVNDNHNTTIGANRPHSNSDSDKSILHGDHGGIKKTQEFTVQYEGGRAL